MLVINKWRHSAPPTSTRTKASRKSKKAPERGGANEGQCAARGGAFALVRLRIAPSFPLDGNHEIVALVGNVTTKDGAPYIHLHITCAGEGGKIVGGHLFEAQVSLTAEIFLHKGAGRAERLRDETLGINKIRFE